MPGVNRLKNRPLPEFYNLSPYLTDFRYESPYRYGRGKFVLILPQTKGDEAWTIAERFRKEVKTQDFLIRDTPVVNKRLSIGGAVLRPSEGQYI